MKRIVAVLRQVGVKLESPLIMQSVVLTEVKRLSLSGTQGDIPINAMVKNRSARFFKPSGSTDRPTSRRISRIKAALPLLKKQRSDVVGFFQSYSQRQHRGICVKTSDFSPQWLRREVPLDRFL